MKAHKKNFNLVRALLFSSFLIAVIFIRYHMHGVKVTQASTTKYLAQRATITTAPSPTVILTAPVNLGVICPVPGKVTFTWNPVPGAANYRFANNPIAQGSTAVFTNSTQTNIAPGSTVNWYVAAERNGELGPESHSTATCPPVPPPTQINVACSGATATLSWYPGSGIYGSGGALRDVTNNTSFSTFGQPGISSTTFNVPSGHQIGGTLFNYIVVGNTNYYSSNATVAPFTCPKPVVLTAPTGLTASCPAPGSKVTYKWNAVPGATGYQFANNPTAQGYTYVTTNSFTVDSTPGSTMKWYVAATNGINVGPESTSTVTCAPVPPPTAIQNSCSGATATTSWTPGPGIYGSGGQFTDVTAGKTLSQWGQPGATLARVNVPNNDIISGYLFNYVLVGNTNYYSDKVTIPQYTCPGTGTPTPTPNPYKCSTDADCTCGKLNNSCAFVNRAYSQGICTTPDFCTGITGKCGPKCVSGSCAFSCPSTTTTPTPTPPKCASGETQVIKSTCAFSSATGSGYGYYDLTGVSGVITRAYLMVKALTGTTPHGGNIIVGTRTPTGNCDPSGIGTGTIDVVPMTLTNTNYDYVDFSGAVSKKIGEAVNISTFSSSSIGTDNKMYLCVKPTTTISPTVPTTCVCNTNNSCDSSCTFAKYTSSDISNVNYSSPIGCSLSSVPFSSTATQTNKNQWCQRNIRTKGDATGDGKVDDLDYFYYVQAVSGGTMPIDSSKSLNVNPDFNGNGSVGTDDRIIIIHSLQSGL